MTTPLDVRLLSELFDGVSGGEVPASKCDVSVLNYVFDGYNPTGAKVYQPNSMYDIADCNWNSLTLSPYGTSFVNKSKANATGTCFEFTTMFEGQYLCIANTKVTGIAQDVRIWIDDQEVTTWFNGTRAAGTLQHNQIIGNTVDGALQTININFARRGIYKVRVAGVAVGGPTGIMACNAEGKFHKPKKQRTFGVISDSWYDLIPANTSLNTGSELAARMGWRQWNMANSGSGFMNPDGSALQYGSTAVFNALAKAPELDLLILNGSCNDLGYSEASVLQAMRDFFTKWRTVRPNTPIVWQGLEPTYYFENIYPIATIIARENAQATEALADASVIGVIRPSLEDWLSGSGNTGAPNGTGNQDWDIGPDGIHPSKFGTIQQGALVHQRLGSIAA